MQIVQKNNIGYLLEDYYEQLIDLFIFRLKQFKMLINYS